MNYLKETFGNVHQRGYLYTEEAIKHPNPYTMTEVYQEIAMKYATTPSRVERAMRHYKETIIKQVGMKKLFEMLEYPYKNKLTNQEFIILIRSKIKNDK